MSEWINDKEHDVRYATMSRELFMKTILEGASALRFRLSPKHYAQVETRPDQDDTNTWMFAADRLETLYDLFLTHENCCGIQMFR